MKKTITSISYEQLEVGQKACITRQITEKDVMMFAALSGDCNPVHLDEQFAANSIFKERIAHGMLSGALISAAIALELPGPGSIYLEQQLSFTRPVRLGDTLSIELKILEKLPKGRVRISTHIHNQQGKAVVQGEALVLAPSQANTIELPEPPQFIAQQPSIAEK